MIDKLPDGSTIVYCRLELEEGLKVVEKCGEYGSVELNMSKEGRWSHHLAWAERYLPFFLPVENFVIL